MHECWYQVYQHGMLSKRWQACKREGWLLDTELFSLLLLLALLLRRKKSGIESLESGVEAGLRMPDSRFQIFH
jgi:hypothetical protein